MLYLVLIVGLVLVDLALKTLAIAFLQPVGSVPLIEGVLHLTYRENTGAAFSLLRGHTELIAVVTAVAICVMLYLILFGKDRGKLLCVSLSLICAGGIGNLYDRLARGFVVDYVDVRLIHFAVFNFADVLVVCGAILLGVSALVWERKKHA